MSVKKVEQNETARKRKRIVPTRAAGAPTFDVVEDLFAAGFAARRVASDEIAQQDTIDSKEPVDGHRHLDTQSLEESETALTTPTLVTSPSQGQKELKTPVAPVNNYQKVTNTITREAIPQGLFKAGKSKQVYDVLYGLTRGAIIPSRVVCISKPKLRTLSGVGARTTMDACLSHLSFVGLIEQRINDGGFHEGNEYEVFTPEEIRVASTLLTTSRQGRQANSAYPANHGYDALKQGVVGSLVSRQGEQGLEAINSEINDIPKTSLKTNTKNDDEAFVDFIGIFEQGSRKLTGKGIQKRDADKWRSLAELLMLELEVAAKRTESVSNVPAFLTEHLRRKLLSGSAHNSAKKQKPQPDIVGKPNESGEYEIKPLGEADREAALEQLREFAGDELLQDFKKWYTEEDWAWLTEELANK